MSAQHDLMYALCTYKIYLVSMLRHKEVNSMHVIMQDTYEM